MGLQVAAFREMTTGQNVFPLSIPAKAEGFPYAIFLARPHDSFQTIESLLPSIKERGYSVIQLPPIHPPGKEDFPQADGSIKMGSVYAPRSHLEVSPLLFAGITPQQYLTGEYDSPSASEGWAALANLVTAAKAYGIEIWGDLVINHTAADGDVVNSYTGKFGKRFYSNKVDGADTESGGYDPWSDSRKIDHLGPRKREIMTYFEDGLRLFLSAGVTGFRADAAAHIPVEFWQPYIVRAGEIAEEMKVARPLFWAEALGKHPKVSEDLIDAGFDAVTSSSLWWTRTKEAWLINQLNGIRTHGGVQLGFVGTQDTDPFAHRRLAERNESFRDSFSNLGYMLHQLAIAFLLNPSTMIMDGVIELSGQRASVFLDKSVRHEDLEAAGTHEEVEKLQALERFLLGLKAGHPVLRYQSPTELQIDGSPVVKVEKSDPHEKILIMINDDIRPAEGVVPREYEKGFVLLVNGENIQTKIDMPSVSQIRLQAGGIAVFQRRAPAGEMFKVPN